MRILRVKFEGQLRERLRKRNKDRLAKEIGISAPKLQDILDDNWAYITRDSIERVADYLDLRVEQVFEFAPSMFWQSIESTRACTFVRGMRQDQTGFRIPGYDIEATQAVQKFLGELGLEDAHFGDDWTDEEELLRLTKTRNCIVVGSPKSNQATEILVSRFFGARPLNPAEENRRKIPFGFCWPQDTPATRQSSLTRSCVAREQTLGKAGIVWSGGQVLIDFLGLREFRSWDTEKGRDYGLVFVADQPSGSKDKVKLIVLAGVSGIGTVAAAKALVRDSRDLQPLSGQKCVWGLVEAVYSKRPHRTDGRTYKRFRWVYREGGRYPVDAKGSPHDGGDPD